MRRLIRVNDQQIEFILRRSSLLRGIKISIKPPGYVVVTAHNLVPEFLIRHFVKQKAEWVQEKLDFIINRNNALQIVDKKQKREVRDKAIVSVLTKVKKWNADLGFEVKKITVKEQKTCWGSCTRSKHLNFNWKLGLMPDHLVDYVVVHELCHLKHFDHSRKFWELVATMIPDYKKRRKELNERGLAIA